MFRTMSFERRKLMPDHTIRVDHNTLIARELWPVSDIDTLQPFHVSELKRP